MPHVVVGQDAVEPSIFAKTSGSGPTVSLGTVTSTNGLAPTRVMVVVRRKLPDLTACFVNNLAITKAVVHYRLVVREDGTVIHVDTTSTALSSTRLARCVRDILGALRFPPVPGGTNAIVTLPLIFDATGASSGVPRVIVDAPEPWTPFSRGTAMPGRAAAGAARIVEAELQKRAATIGACFGVKGPTGSLRVMLEVVVGGKVGIVRAGGLGDVKGEACVEKLVGELAVVTPIDEHVELACDLARGDARPWRIALESYGVIDVEPTQLRHAEHTLLPGGGEPEPLPVNTYVVVADLDTPGAMLQLAMMWAADAHAVLLALRDGAGPPMFLGVADTTGELLEEGGTPASVRITKTTISSCTNGTTEDAKLSEVGTLVGKLAATCRTKGCAPALYVDIDSDAVARDLLEVASAARRAGFARLLFRTSDTGCAAVEKTTRRRGPRDLRFDLD